MITSRIFPPSMQGLEANTQGDQRKTFSTPLMKLAILLENLVRQKD
jgi:hypothetical protein